MKQAPLVSIGVPALNEEKYLRKTLESLLAQDYANIEILITDNGSTDSTQSICEEYVARRSSISYLRFSENKGAIASFNTCFRRANGTYFMWSGAHDLWDAHYVSTCCAYLEGHAAVVGVYPIAVRIDALDQKMGRYEDFISTEGMHSPYERYAYVLSHLYYCNLIHGVWRRDALAKSGLFSEKWAPDNLVIARMSIEGEFAQIPEEMFFRREVRKREQSRAEKDMRILKSLTPSLRKGISIHALHKHMHMAHLRMVCNLSLPWLARIRLFFITLSIFCIRRYAFPGGALVHTCISSFPLPWRLWLYNRLQSKKKSL